MNANSRDCYWRECVSSDLDRLFRFFPKDHHLSPQFHLQWLVLSLSVAASPVFLLLTLSSSEVQMSFSSTNNRTLFLSITSFQRIPFHPLRPLDSWVATQPRQHPVSMVLEPRVSRTSVSRTVQEYSSKTPRNLYVYELNARTFRY